MNHCFMHYFGVKTLSETFFSRLQCKMVTGPGALQIYSLVMALVCNHLLIITHIGLELRSSVRKADPVVTNVAESARAQSCIFS